MQTKIMTTIFLMMISLILNTRIYADDVNSNFHLTLINNSNETFVIKSVLTRAGVTIQPNQELWEPNKKLQIKCVNVASNGIAGRILFVDGKRKTNQLFIEVREQRHYGQPAYGMHNQFYSSTVLEQNRNKNIGGRFLTHTSATVELHNN